ncbi:hypothetical protein [Paenibacillus medicaginis]|uniref:Uncharacterized protein n=1 Tax=Paenibacillus medicaginis TaxID=1470560 RepID=A0ABV5C627_9BACL
MRRLQVRYSSLLQARRIPRAVGRADGPCVCFGKWLAGNGHPPFKTIHDMLAGPGRLPRQYARINGSGGWWQSVLPL